MRITNHQYLRKVFQLSKKKLGTTTGYSTFCNRNNTDQCIDMGIVHVFVNESSHSFWTTLITEFGSIQEHELRWNSEFYSISHRNWYWNILKRFWMCVRLKAHIPDGRDRHCLVIKWFSGQKQKYVSTHNPYCVWGRCGLKKMQLQDGKVKWRIQNVSFFLNWIRVEYFPRILVIADSSEKCSMTCKYGTLNLKKFTDRSIFMSMFNDIDWTKKGNDEICISTSEKIKSYAKKFSQGYWAFLGPGDEKKWYGKAKYFPEGKWSSVASQMVQRCKETSHPVFTSASALSRGILRILKGKETIHFNADASNTELLFRIIHSLIRRKGTSKKPRQRRIREQRNTKTRECTRSELFGCDL